MNAKIPALDRLAGATLVLWIAASGCTSSPPPLELPIPSPPNPQAMIQAVQAELETSRPERGVVGLNADYLRRTGTLRIEEASPRERELSRAVARVCSASTEACATGFFISADGLFLTNEHVVDFDTCTLERCAGYQIIRDATEGGALETYGRVQALVAGRRGHGGLDFSLLRVELPAGREVPFLPLQSENSEQTIRSAMPRMRQFGHPFAGPLRTRAISPSRKEPLRPEHLHFRSLTVPGDSGGVVVDLETGKAVLLAHSAEQNSSIVYLLRPDGTLPRTEATGTFSDSIFAAIQEIIPALERPEQLTAAFLATQQEALWNHRFGVLSSRSSSSTRDVEAFPSLTEYLLNGSERDRLGLGPLGTEQFRTTFFHHYFGTPFEAETWAWAADSALQAGSPRTVFQLVNSVLTISQMSGTRLSAEFLSMIRSRIQLALSRLSPEDQDGVSPVIYRFMSVIGWNRVQQGEIARRNCIESANGITSQIFAASVVSQLCGELSLRVGDESKSVFAHASEELRLSSEPLDEDAFHLAARFYLRAIEVRTLTENERADAIAYLELLLERAPTWFGLADVQSQLELLRQAPNLVGYGRFQGGYEIPEQSVTDQIYDRLEALMDRARASASAEDATPPLTEGCSVILGNCPETAENPPETARD